MPIAPPRTRKPVVSRRIGVSTIVDPTLPTQVSTCVTMVARVESRLAIVLLSIRTPFIILSNYIIEKPRDFTNNINSK